MSNDKQLLEQALEALEMAAELEEGYGVDFKKYGLKVDKDIRAKYNATITTIRARLDHMEDNLTMVAAPVQEPVIDHSCKDTYELIMKWADIYAAQTGELYSQAAQDPSKAARMADERTMLACVVAQAFPSPAAQPAPVQEPLFWYRPVGEDGGYEGPLHNGVIEKVRKECGAWKPLYTTPPAQPTTEESSAVAAPMQELDHGDELTIAYMSGLQRGKELAAQPAPVQCWKCGDMDAEFQAYCKAPACGMKENT